MSFYYNLKVVMCRERGDAKAVGSKTYSEPSRAEWVYTYENQSVVEAQAEADFLDSLEDAIAEAPQHIKLLKKSGTGSLKAALDISATVANDQLAAQGAWSERVGKDVFRYEIGVSSGSAANALSNRTAHNLS